MLGKLKAVAKRVIEWFMAEDFEGDFVSAPAPSVPPVRPVHAPVVEWTISPAPVPSPLSSRLTEVRKVDTLQEQRKRAFQEWKQNMSDYDKLRSRLATA